MADQQGCMRNQGTIIHSLLEILESNADKNYVTLFVILNNLGQNRLHEKKYDEAINYMFTSH